jgi:hypothetical protein
MRIRGVCHVYFAVDIGFAIDLVHSDRLLASSQTPQQFKKPRRATQPEQLQRRALRAAQSGTCVAIGAFATEPTVELTLWEFGAVTVAYRIPLEAELSELVQLSDSLWGNALLLDDVRNRGQQLLAAISPAVDKPSLGARIEDYAVFELRLPAGSEVAELWTSHAVTTASILRAEPEALSQEEIADALAMRCAYLPGEIVLVDWFAAVLVGDDMEDERLVLELTIAELLELRLLDEQLDRGIDAAYGLFSRSRRRWLSALSTRAADLELVSQLQADAAVLFEGVDNALKLLGDQYLARLYRIASARFHLPQWDAAIERKLRVLDGIYEKLAGRATSRRFEILEVIVVLLIAVSIAMPFLLQ